MGCGQSSEKKPEAPQATKENGEATNGKATNGQATNGHSNGQSAGKVQVHGMPASANSVCAILLAMEAGAGQMQLCDLMKGDQMKPEFLAMNPFHHIPTMKDGDIAVGESTACIRYLAMKYKPELYPVSDPTLCGFIDFACDSFGGEVYPKISYGVFYPVFGFSGPVEDQAKANQEATAVLDTWMKHFVKGKFACSDNPTIADYKAVPFLWACMQPAIEKKTGFKLSDRAKQYVTDFMETVKATEFMKSAGGYSLAEFAALKGEPNAGAPAAVAKGTFPATPALGKPDGKVKVHAAGISQNAMSSVMLAVELGVGEMKVCDLSKGDQNTPEYLAMNPFHHVPVLQDGGFAIGESNACLRYLAMKYKPELYPVKDPAVCGKIDFACESFAGDVYPKVAYDVVYPVFGFGTYPKDPKRQEDQGKCNKVTGELLDQWVKHFVGSGKFVNGESLSIADYKVAPFMFALTQPAIQKKTGFKVSEAVEKYAARVISATPKGSEFLSGIKEHAAMMEYAPGTGL